METTYEYVKGCFNPEKVGAQMRTKIYEVSVRRYVLLNGGTLWKSEIVKDMPFQFIYHPI